MANGANDAAGAAPKVRKPRSPAKPKPGYIVYTVNDDQTITIHTATRKADTVLEQTAGQSEKKYARFEM